VDNPHCFIVTGLSGSGKSTAIHVFEDNGYFSVDNFPVQLLGPFLDLTTKAESEVTRVALVMDLREPDFAKLFLPTIRALRDRQHDILLLYLEADDRVIRNRFSATRRPHPQARGEPDLAVAIHHERKMMQGAREAADLIVDTTDMAPHLLRSRLESLLQTTGLPRKLHFSIVSFGYRYGTPTDVDMIFDVRFLPNPHFVDQLRPLTGIDNEVSRYIFAQPVSTDLLEHLLVLLRFMLPKFVDEGKTYVCLAIGCTGGKHRSVAVANALAASLGDGGVTIDVRHRDIAKG